MPEVFEEASPKAGATDVFTVVVPDSPYEQHYAAGDYGRRADAFDADAPLYETRITYGRSEDAPYASITLNRAETAPAPPPAPVSAKKPKRARLIQHRNTRTRAQQSSRASDAFQPPHEPRPPDAPPDQPLTSAT